MGRLRRHILAALPSLVLASCAGSAGTAVGGPAGEEGATTQLTRVGEAVQVTQNAVSVRDCEFIANLPAQGPVTDDAILALRNEAGRRGANLVLLVMEDRTTLARAEGYLCAD